jgi:hypothetical protein
VTPGGSGTAGLEVGKAPQAQHDLLDEVVSRALTVGQRLTTGTLGGLRQADELHAVPTAHVALSPFLRLASEA